MLLPALQLLAAALCMVTCLAEAADKLAQRVGGLACPAAAAALAASQAWSLAEGAC